MKPRELISFLGDIEKLKCNTRHSWTSSGRQESVAEHSWRLAVMAMLCQDEYPSLDMERVVKMCLLHDLGEAVMGDIPAFWKTEQDKEAEGQAVRALFGRLPETIRREWQEIYEELTAQNTEEAKLFKALDNLEAVLSHNEADLATWLPLEHTENLVYGQENCDWSPWTKEMREELRKDSLLKLEKEGKSE